eukprot:TRINITY_DN1090_c0_g1_i1.p1 TRINITY_DN1090_c0_g1~~TRINITY_DN1090_c0_g1_i1.p1  ORF type:complete len:519 (-),score=103.83 TRINITY_DN1090_c0_g1_i1:242-1798(-)
MNRFSLLLVSGLVCLSVASAAEQDGSRRIKHVVTLMMENRAFDHMLGWLKEDGHPVDGLTKGMGQPLDPTRPAKGWLNYTRDAPDVGDNDPDHGFEGTAFEIFGSESVHVHGPYPAPSMNGFAAREIQRSANPKMVTQMFDRKSAPIINTLAVEFAVIDSYHCSLPGPTDPNRAFAMTGTSNGMITNFNGTPWSQTSYFEYLRRNNRTFAGYYQDDLWALGYCADMLRPPNSKHVQDMDDKFFEDARAGRLADFVWLQPRMTAPKKGPPTWQHPDAAVSDGEALIKDVYEALRASPAWNATMFILFYDEHGGIADHVAPPQTGVPSPDGVRAPNGFGFDRLGVRVPFVVVSPWVRKGTVVHHALPGEQPTPTSAFDATSVLATANQLLGVDAAPLTARMAWANTFAGLVKEGSTHSSATLREDCPTTLPAVPQWTPERLAVQRAKPLNDHLEIELDLYCRRNFGDLHARGECPGSPDRLRTQGEASDWLQVQTARYVARLRAEEAAYDAAAAAAVPLE